MNSQSLTSSTTPSRSRAVRLVAAIAFAVVGVVCLALPGAKPASADSNTDTYNSLAAAMVSYWATQSGTDTSNFMSQNASQLSSMLGVSPAQLLSGTANGSNLNAASLNSLLSGSSNSLSFASLPSMSSLFSQLQTSAPSIDSVATLAGSKFATTLGSQYAPSLANAASQDSLLFGTFYDKTLTNLVGGSPDLFAQVAKTGLGSASATAAWNAALAKATKASTVSLSALPDQCGLAMMQAMGSGVGNPSGACGACAVAGTYLHTQLGNILNPSKNSVIPTTGTNTTNSSSWSTMQGWLQQGTLKQNPSLGSALSGASSGASAANACIGSSTATSGALSTTLPGVFANLGR